MMFELIACYLKRCPVNVLAMQCCPVKLVSEVSEVVVKVAASWREDWRCWYTIFCTIWRCGNPVFVAGWLVGYGCSGLAIAVAAHSLHSTLSILGMVSSHLRCHLS